MIERIRMWNKMEKINVFLSEKEFARLLIEKLSEISDTNNQDTNCIILHSVRESINEYMD